MSDINNQSTGKISYSLDITKFNKSINGNAGVLWVYYTLCIIVSMSYIMSIGVKKYKYESINEKNIKLGKTEYIDNDVIYNFQSYTTSSPFNIITTESYDTHMGFSRKSYICIIIAYTIPLLLIIDSLVKNHLFANINSFIHTNSKNNPYNNPDMITKLDVNLSATNVKNYSKTFGLSLFFLVPFIIYYFLKFFHFDNYDIKKNKYIGYIIFFLLFFPLFAIFIFKTSLSEQLNVLNKLNKYIEQKDYNTYIDNINKTYNKTFLTIAFVLFVVISFIMYKIVYLNVDNTSIFSKIIIVLLIIVVLFVIIPLMLIYYSNSLLLQNFGDKNYTNDLEDYIKKNSITNVFSLIVKYNYPCFNK